MSDSTQFSIDIDVPSGSLESAAAKVARLGEQLTQATQATKAAEAATNAASAAYKSAEAAANRAAGAAEKIGLAVTAQTGKAAAIAAEFGLFSPQFQKASDALAALTAKQTEAQAKATAAAAAMKAQAAAVDALDAKFQTAAKHEDSLTKAQKSAADQQSKFEKQTKDAADAQNQSVGAAGLLEGAFAKLGGPLGEAGQKISGLGGAVLKMSKSLGSAGPYVAIAVAIVAIGTAAIAATVAVTSWAIGLADAARSQGLIAAGIARTVGGGAALNAKIDDLTSKLPTTRDELLSLAGPLADSGLRGKELGDALQNAAIKAAQLKFGPEFQKEMLSIPNQIARIQTGFSKIFSGLKIDKLLEALGRVTDLFAADSATANALKVVFESLFQPLIDGITGLVPKMVSMFIQFEILCLQAMIAIKPWGSQIAYLGYAFAALAGVIVAALLVALIPIAIVTVAVVALVAAVIWLGVEAYKLAAAILDGMVSALNGVRDGVTAVIDFLSGLSLASIGESLIQGLVDGITGSAASVLASITDVVGGAIGAAKSLLQINSPSKVFAKIGASTGEGMVDGVDGSAADVQGSLESLVAPPTSAGAGSSGAGGSPAKGGGAVYNITVNASGGADGPSIATAVREALQDLVTQSGGSYA